MTSFFCVSGKDYALVHAAPIVAVFVLDHDMQPLPSPSELEAKAFPGKPHLLTTPTLYDRHRPKHGPSTLPCDSNTGTNKGEIYIYIYILIQQSFYQYDPINSLKIAIIIIIIILDCVAAQHEIKT